MTQPVSDRSANDRASRPGGLLIWWGAPFLVGLTTYFLRLPMPVTAFVWTIAFMWMGVGCVLNAMRCHRLHCYISGPVFLSGAVACGLLGAGVLDLGPHALNNTVSITLVLVLLSFAPEFIWRRYA